MSPPTIGPEATGQLAPLPTISASVLTAYSAWSSAISGKSGMLRKRSQARSVFGKLPGLSGPIIRLLDRDPTHLHKWPRQRWLDWAQSHFFLVEWKGILRYLLPGGYYLHLVTQVFRRHTPAIIVTARKR